MTAALSFRHIAFRLLPLTCLLLVADVARAQATGDYCEPTPAIKAELKTAYDENLPFSARIVKQKAIMQELFNKYPNDFFVRRRYQDSRRAGFFTDMDPIIADYRAQMEKNPNDPVAAYLYARLLVGRQTKEAMAIAEKLTQQHPEFPWTHMQLAEIYTYPAFRDPAKSKEHLKQWIAKCPNDKTSLSMMARSGDKELMAAAAERMRSLLNSSSNNEDLNYWGELWALQFKLRPVPEHEQIRKQIAEEVKALRAKNLNTKEWLDAIRSGYAQAGDKVGQHWAEDEMVRLFPKSDSAKRMIQSRYEEEHPYPKPDEPEEKQQAYYQARLQTTSEWLKQWPNDERSWSTRIFALEMIKGAKGEDMQAAYEGYAKAHELEGFSYMTPPIEVTVARYFLDRGYHVENVPALIEKGLTEVEKREKSRGVSDLFNAGDGIDTNLNYSQWQAWPVLAEAYAKTKQPAKANQVLADMAESLKKKEPAENASDAKKRSYAHSAGIYWETVGKVAEAEQRKLDALTAYQTAIAMRPKSSPPSDELTGKTQRLWKELGGTDQGWRAYTARAESKSKPETAEAATWDSKNTAMAAFDLMDLEGRKWSLADLKGKVAFINLWATWCGPCRMELPYVQKLREQMKDRKDVVVLTLNIDEEVGMVQPFMKENKYTFPVLLGEAYADEQGVNSIPRNWVISVDGKVVFEGVGFGNDGEDWIKKATQMIEKVKGAN